MLMVLLLSPASLGLYVVAVTLSGGVSLVSGAIATVTFPTISQTSNRKSRECQQATLGRLLRINLWATSSAAIILIVLAPWLVALLFGQGFSGSILATRVLSLAAIVSGSNAILSSSIKGLGEPLISTYAELAGLAATALFLFLLLPTWQIVGAAMASLLAYSVSFLYMLVQIRRELGINLLAVWAPQPGDREALLGIISRVRQRLGVRG
jgi:O-antigen/teichoic acid export membrane protein